MSARRRVSAYLSRSPRARLALLLTAPLLWLGLAYLGALAALLVTALWSTNSFTGDIERIWTLDNIRTVLGDSVYRAVTLRTIGVAALVTVIDGSPGALSWLGGVKGMRVSPLGIDRFGQTGDLPDLYRTYRLDADAIVDAAAELFLGN